ncbi:MAG TPA: TMEM14 family protein [Elainellaceae cyanobacterium]
MTVGIIAAIAYGALALVGGIIGYTKAKSLPSLISGVISGALLILGGTIASLGASWGIVLSMVVTTILVIVFVVRLTKTRKFMPAGLMVIVGVAAFILMWNSI